MKMRNLVVLAAMVLAATGAKAENYGITVAGVEVTDKNYLSITGSNIKQNRAGETTSVLYNPAQRTLYVRNVRIERTGSNNRAIRNYGCEGLTIVFIGENVLKAASAAPLRFERATTLRSEGGAHGTDTTRVLGGSEGAIFITGGHSLTLDGANLYATTEKYNVIEGNDNQMDSLVVRNSTLRVYSEFTFNNDAYVDYSLVRSLKLLEVANSDVWFITPKWLSYKKPYRPVPIYKLKAVALRDGERITIGELTNTSSSNAVLPRSVDEAGLSVAYFEPSLVKIDEANFPDENLRRYVAKDYSDKGEYLYNSDMGNQTKMSVSDKGITSLKGLEYFANLEELYCGKNKLTTLDCSPWPKLKVLSCYNNQLTQLNISNNEVLENLSCYNNPNLGSLTFHSNSRLNNINVRNAGLTDELDVSGLLYLHWLDCASNAISSLKLPKTDSLTSVNCRANKLKSLSTTMLNELRVLYCDSNELTGLYISPRDTALLDISCYDNQLPASSINALIAYLPNRAAKATGGMLTLRRHHQYTYEEGNAGCTEQMLASAKAKGWEMRCMYTTRDGYLVPQSKGRCEDYDLWIGDVRMTSHTLSSGRIKYDPETKTLLATINDGKSEILYSYRRGKYNEKVGRTGLLSEIEGLTIRIEGDPLYSKGIACETDDSIAAYFGGSTELTSDLENAYVARRGGNGADKQSFYVEKGTLTVSGKMRVACDRLQGGEESRLCIKDSARITIYDVDLPSVIGFKELVMEGNIGIIEPADGVWNAEVRAITLRGSDEPYRGSVVIGYIESVLGDVNQDGEINTSDVVAIYNYIIDGEASGILKDNADVDADGEVGTADVVALYNIIINGE